MTDSMIERVARAVVAMDGSDPDTMAYSPGFVLPKGPLGTSVLMERQAKPLWMHAEDIARAAVGAMREPTDAMTKAFDCSCDEYGQVLGRHGYKAMIDAALVE